MKTTGLTRVIGACFAGLALVGCGGPATSDPGAPTGDPVDLTERAETRPAPPETPAGSPQIGERIDDRASSGAGADNSLAAAGAEAAAEAAAGQSRGVREIGWEDLMPEGEEERLAQMYQQQMATLYSQGGVAEGSPADKAVQIGTFSTVEALDGQRVRLPGYTVPFDYGADTKVTEFLLVPYFGACIHAPPPPPNQTLFVMAENALKIEDLSQAVWVEGTLHAQTQESELADAAYTLTLETLEPYEY